MDLKLWYFGIWEDQKSSWPEDGVSRWPCPPTDTLPGSAQEVWPVPSAAPQLWVRFAHVTESQRSEPENHQHREQKHTCWRWSLCSPGERQEHTFARPPAACTPYSLTHRQFSVSNQHNVHVFSVWEETRAPGESPHTQGENIKTLRTPRSIC